MQPDGPCACNEAISWLFLRAAGLSAPKHAAILVLSQDKAVQVLGRKSVPTGWVNTAVTDQLQCGYERQHQLQNSHQPPFSPVPIRRITAPSAAPSSKPSRNTAQVAVRSPDVPR